MAIAAVLLTLIVGASAAILGQKSELNHTHSLPAVVSHEAPQVLPNVA